MAKIGKITNKLPKPYYAAIGKITYYSARFEFNVQQCIWEMLGVHKKAGRMLTVGMKVKPLLAIMKNLVTNFTPSPTLKQEFNSIAKAAHAAIEARNSICHGIWTTPQGRKQIYELNYMMEADERYLPKAERLSSADVQAIGDAWEQINARLDAALNQLHALPQSSREKPIPLP
jgi:hypothetical protein